MLTQVLFCILKQLLVCVCVSVPARFQARQSHNAAILSVYFKHALGLRLLGKGQHVVGVAVGCIDLTNQATLEGIRYHGDEDFQGGDGGFILTVPDDSNKYPGGRGKTWLPRVTRLSNKNKKKQKQKKKTITAG